MGLFFKKKKSNPLANFDYENYEKTFSLFNEEQTNYWMQQSHYERKLFEREVLMSIPSVKQNFEFFMQEILASIDQFGLDTKENKMLYFCLHNKKKWGSVAYEHIFNMINAGTMDPFNACWYDETLIEDGLSIVQIATKVKMFAVALNEEAQAQLNIAEDEMIDENYFKNADGTIMSYQAMRQKFVQKFKIFPD